MRAKLNFPSLFAWANFLVIIYSDVVEEALSADELHFVQLVRGSGDFGAIWGNLEKWVGILIFMSHLLGLQFVRQLYGRFSRALCSLVAFVFTGSCENHLVSCNSALNPKPRNTICFFLVFGKATSICDSFFGGFRARSFRWCTSLCQILADNMDAWMYFWRFSEMRANFKFRSSLARAKTPGDNLF